MSMPMHYYPLSGPLQFAGPNSQTQSQSMQGTLLPMPIVPLQMGNGPQIQQQVFIPSIQHHLVQSQRNMHEGQGLGFSPHMVPQLPHHLGNVGMNLSPPFAQHQNGKIDSNRKAVKITDPKTHEELRLDKRADVCTDDGSAGSRLHHSFPPQSRPPPAFATTPLGYYVNSYNAGTPIFLPPSSLPLVGTQLSSSGQVTGFNSLVSQAPPNVTFMNPSPFKSLSINKVETSAHGPGEPTTLGHPLDAQQIISSPQSTTIPVTIKPVAGFARESVIDSNIAEKGDLPELLRLPGSSYVQKNSEMSSENASLLSSSVFEQSQESPASVASESPTPGTAYSIPTSAPGEPALIVSDVDDRGMEIAGKMAGKTGHSQPLHQVDGQSDTSFPAQAADCSDSSKIRPSEPLETRIDHALPAACEHDTHAATTDVCGPADGFLESATCSSPVIHGMRIIRNTAGKDDIPLQEGTLQKSVGPGEHGEKEHNGHLMPDIDLNNGPASNSLKDAEVEKTTQDAGVGVVGTFQSDDQSTTHAEVDWRPADTSTSVQVPSIATDGHNMSLSNASLNRIDSMSCNEDHTKSGISHSEMATVPVNPSEENSRYEGEVIECTRPTFSSGPV
ncbi:hypothetical protein Nepgr_024202 [Nepenthes gracilis]|uniref:Uncharacterized protein n=1 Tax=Nepenthes gracilis TaxID=150966 RepID=A0AAD3T460_NEPGR|nr:hypothetical protein Nepgr_024202 [Nepenthes gracilis]